LKAAKNNKKLEVKICVVIATRNRRDMLCKLLQSIEDNELKPDQISIVSSGEEIVSVITKFNKNLKITHKHTNRAGQVLQRSMALENLINVYDGYVFLDDDVTVGEKLFLKIGLYLKSCDEQVGGVGLNLQGKPRSKKKKVYLKKRIRSILNDRIAGRVLKSGRNVKYRGAESVKQVMWLNALSVWTNPVISKVKHVGMGNKYAAAEDLIYSYKVGKTYKLYYNPGLVVYKQVDDEGIIPKLDIYRTSWQHKLYFVLTNKELKFSLFILDNIMDMCLLLLSAFKRNPRIKIRIAFYNFRFIYLIIKNRSNLINNTRFQEHLLNRIM
jgi:hypothetical protein